MPDHSPLHDHHLPAASRRPVRHAASLARSGVGLRLLVAAALIAVTWAAILPLVT